MAFYGPPGEALGDFHLADWAAKPSMINAAYHLSGSCVSQAEQQSCEQQCAGGPDG